MFIKADNELKIGDVVITTKKFEAMSGQFTTGSVVRIVDIDSMRGYSIEDDLGNRLTECGFNGFKKYGRN